MLLTVVLIILTLVMSVMCLGVYVWWKKYGKDMFITLKKMNDLPKNQNYPIDSTLINQQMDILNQFFGKK